MSAEIAASSALGVTAASVIVAYDPVLAMASAGGCFFFLAASVAMALQPRILFAMGSFVLGYLAGSAALWQAQSSLDYAWMTGWAGFIAFSVSAIGSKIFGSISAWQDGGPRPPLLDFIIGLLPFKIKKGPSND